MMIANIAESFLDVERPRKNRFVKLGKSPERVADKIQNWFETKRLQLQKSQDEVVAEYKRTRRNSKRRRMMNKNRKTIEAPGFFVTSLIKCIFFCVVMIDVAEK